MLAGCNLLCASVFRRLLKNLEETTDAPVGAVYNRTAEIGHFFNAGGVAGN
jgi:hypothetical protein